MQTPLTIAILVAVSGSASAQSWQEVAPGVEYAELASGATKVYASRIDLCAPGVRMRATRPGEGPRTVSSYGELSGAALAINGDWWSVDGEPHLPSTYPRGLGMGDGVHFEGTVDRPSYGVVAFGPSIALHSIMEDDLGGPHWWMQDVVSGQPTLVWDGQLRDNPASHCGVRRARTATGFDEARTTMYMAVVQEIDGSQGMTCNEMAALMKQLGAYSALNQDGGGSSTMWIKGRGVVNKPSDGQQRSLVNHWGVIASGWGPPRSCVARDVVPPANGVKRHVTNPEMMAAWGFSFDDLGFMAADQLAMYEDGVAMSAPPRFARDDEGGVWLIDQGTRRQLPTPATLAAWRVDAAAVPVASAELAELPVGPALRAIPILIVIGDGTVYLLDDQVAAGGDPGDGGGGGEGSGSDDEAPDGVGGCAATSPSTPPASGTAVLLLLAIGCAPRRRPGRAGRRGHAAFSRGRRGAGRPAARRPRRRARRRRR